MKKLIAILKIKTFFGYEILAITIIMFLLTFFGIKHIHNNLKQTSNIVSVIDSNNYDMHNIILDMNKLYIADEKAFYSCLNTGKSDSNNVKLLNESELIFINDCISHGINTDSVNQIFVEKKTLLDKIKINKVSKIHINRFKVIDSIPQVNTIETHKIFKNTKEKQISYKKYEKIDKYELMYNISVIEKNNIKKTNDYITENIELDIKLRNLVNSSINDITIKSKEKGKISVSKIKDNINSYEKIVFSLSILLSFVIVFLVYDIEKKRSVEYADKTFIRELINKILKRKI